MRHGPVKQLGKIDFRMWRRWLTAFIGLILLLAAIAGYFVIAEFHNPLRQSNDEIRSSLFEQTPLGMTQAEFEFFLETKGWKHTWTTDEHGRKLVRAIVGEYQGFPWWVFVEVAWTFDDQGKLFELQVDKIYDSP